MEMSCVYDIYVQLILIQSKQVIVAMARAVPKLAGAERPWELDTLFLPEVIILYVSNPFFFTMYNRVVWAVLGVLKTFYV